MRAKFDCGQTGVSEKRRGGGTDRQTHKRTLQLYIVDEGFFFLNIHYCCCSKLYSIGLYLHCRFKLTYKLTLFEEALQMDFIVENTGKKPYDIFL